MLKTVGLADRRVAGQGCRKTKWPEGLLCHVDTPGKHPLERNVMNNLEDLGQKCVQDWTKRRWRTIALDLRLHHLEYGTS